MIEIFAMKSILIIGASRGIGLELVRQYTEDGRRVIATVRDDAGRERVQSLGADVLTVDVAHPASVSGLAWQLDGEKLDLAIYVAGIIRRPNALTPPTQQDFDAVMHTNVLGAMQAIPQVAPRGADAGGVFAFLSSSMSQIGSVPNSDAWLYRTSKAALNMAVAAAHVGLHPAGVDGDQRGAGVVVLCRRHRHVQRGLAGAVQPRVAVRHAADLRHGR